MDGTEQKFLKSIEQFHMLQPGDRVIAAVSGGADSVCLLTLLCGLEKEWELSLRTVHVHHGLRGGEADRDAAYVEGLCRTLGVPVKVVHVNVRQYAGEQGLSEEEAGRILRYEALEREAAAWESESEERRTSQEEGGRRPPSGAVKIAVAHHGDDQAETILHNLCRGSGLAGLGGMQPVNGRIIRPLLTMGRQDILNWLAARKLEFCQDSSNWSDHYTRNRIRSQLIPVIESQVNTGAVDNILRLGRIAAQADACLRDQARQWIQSHVIPLGEETAAKLPGGRRSSLGIPADQFRAQADILRSYTIYLLLCEMAGGARDLTAAHVDQVMELFEKPVGRRISLPGRIWAVRSYEGVILENGISQGQSDARQGQSGDKVLPSAQITCFSYKKGMEIPKNQYTKWFDCGKIKGAPVVRNRETGDYITLADGCKKTIRRFMIDEKIPKEQRNLIPLLADGKHIMWIIGYRISEYYKIGPDTTRVLQASALVPERQGQGDRRINEGEKGNDGGKSHGRQDSCTIDRG